MTISKRWRIGTLTATWLFAGCIGQATDDVTKPSGRSSLGLTTDRIRILLDFNAQYLTQSDVLIFNQGGLTDNGNGTSTLSSALYSSQLHNDQTDSNGNRINAPLCSSERFLDQRFATSGGCSGTLVGPDVVATAGHCVSGGITGMKFAFHFRMDGAGVTRTTIPNADIYSAVNVIDTRDPNIAPDHQDWALVRLDRVVPNRRIAPFRMTGIVGNSDALAMIGHPNALPYKYVGNAIVRNNSSAIGISYNLDGLPGNSGSGVFSAVPASLGMLEAIHTNGSVQDFLYNATSLCYTSNVVPDTASSVFGNRVTKFGGDVASGTGDVATGVIPGVSSTFFADITGDSPHKADLVAVKWDGIYVRSSSGTSFGSAVTTGPEYLGQSGNFFADVTGDGKADAIVSNGSIIVRRSTGTSFGGNETWDTNFSGSRGTYFADVNADGRADAIIVTDTDVEVRLSTGSAFSSTTTVWISSPFFGRYGTYFADVDNDGRADAIMVTDTGVMVRHSNGSAFPSLTATQNFTGGAYFGSLGTHFADVTGDGKADGIVVNSNAIVVRRANTTSTAFNANETWTTGGFYGHYGTFFADVTGDGKADAIVVNQGSVVVRPSTGSAFGTAQTWFAGTEHGTVGVFPSSAL